MILPSDEQNALTGIGRYLSEQEPRLAAKFAIFTRLTSEEGEPPDEDLIRAIRPPMPSRAPRGIRAFSAAARSRQRRARHLRGAPRRRSIVVVPAALLLLLVVIITISLAKGAGCATRPTTAREPAVAGHAVVRTCRQAGATKTSSSSR